MGRRTLALVCLLGGMAACGRRGEETTVQTGALSQAFESTATRTHVPRDLLVAIAAVEGGLEMPRIREGLEPNPEMPAAGPLMLRRGKLDTLARGASLTGVAESDLRRDADLALDAGARVLAELGSGDDL